ncbi:MAG: hypothetical protein PHP69_06465 [Candidatus Omnitrophica bacterium]|nr:hypothetical protein [Candidatus Omnitrophota bacterium]
MGISRLLGQYKNIIIVVGMLAVFGFLGKSIYENNNNQIYDCDKQLSEIEKIKTAVKEWQVLSKKYEKVRASVFQGSSVEFKKYVEQTAYEHKIQVYSLEPRAKNEEDYATVNIQIEFFSEYKSIIDFLTELETKNVFVRDISFVHDKNGTGNRVKAVFEGIIFN